MRASLLAVVIAVALLLSTSCAAQQSGTEQNGAPAPRGIEADTPEKRRLLAAVRNYNESFQTGDYKSVFRLQNDLCRGLSWEDGLSNQVKQAARRYGEPQRLTSFGAKMERRIAFVTYTFSDRRLNRRGEAWTPTRGGWRYADC